MSQLLTHVNPSKPFISKTNVLNFEIKFMLSQIGINDFKNLIKGVFSYKDFTTKKKSWPLEEQKHFFQYIQHEIIKYLIFHDCSFRIKISSYLVIKGVQPIIKNVMLLSHLKTFNFKCY
jgi:hypothetical protein